MFGANIVLSKIIADTKNSNLHVKYIKNRMTGNATLQSRRKLRTRYI